MSCVALVKPAPARDDGRIDDAENDMDDEAIEDLQGRVDAVAQALLRLAAELEMTGLIDGSRLSAAWRAHRSLPDAPAALQAASLRTRAQMADVLDAARAVRRSRSPR